MDTRTYPTNLPDAEWRVVQFRLPSEAKTGRPRQHLQRAMLHSPTCAICGWM